MAGREAKVLFEYVKDEVDELTLAVGDIIKNVTPVPNVDGWCEGDLNGVRGMFPSNFVEFLPNSNNIDATQSTADAGSGKNQCTNFWGSQAINYDFVFFSIIVNNQFV